EKISSEKNRYIFIDVYTHNQQIIIKLKDNAGGVKSEALDKIFDQHFSTKKDEGSGIGLFMSKQIIEEHMSGELKVENIDYEYQNENYHGAQFTIVLKEEEIN
ncbi:MAG: histidine kinase, partial [Campylobacteraceae bacterium]|nr:histidine kinase [Campylobacteraceae bacterium]